MTIMYVCDSLVHNETIPYSNVNKTSFKLLDSALRLFLL